MNKLERLSANYQVDQVLSRELFFVCGSPKSGTTWLQRLLDAHPEVMCAGEGHFFDKLSQDIATVFRGYNQQQTIVAERVYEGKPYYSGAGQADLDFLMQGVVALMMARRGVAPNVRCIGDKTPRYTEHLASVWRIFPDSKVIHIIRDARDVVASSLHHRLRAGFSDALDQNAPSFNEVVRASTDSWVTHISKARRQGELRATQYMEVRYEDLLSRPLESLTAVMAFLRVSEDVAYIKDCLDVADFKKLSGREKGEEDKQSFFRKGIAGDWKNVLGEQGHQVVLQQAGSWLKTLGYIG